MAEETRAVPLDLTGQVFRSSTDPVAAGGFANIWHGRYRGKLVAMKYPRPLDIEPEKLAKRLKRELESWARTEHKNILPLLGYCTDFGAGPLPCFISPWMVNGTAVNFLIQYPDADRMKLIEGLAAGLAYMHSINIVHGDIRCINILVTTDGEACISDFGLSRHIDSVTASTAVHGSMRWRAPELCFPDQYGLTIELAHRLPSDVWSFGMTVLEFITAREPYCELQRDIFVLHALQNSNTPQKPASSLVSAFTFNYLWETCMQCWNFVPTARPSMATLHDMMLKIITSPPNTTPELFSDNEFAGVAESDITGCFTCRIRRKKCDQETISDGDCKTCTTLRLQCLGYGANFPQWLDNCKVVEFREKIKNFLSSQDIFKGISGPEHRGFNQGSSTLCLTDKSPSRRSPLPMLLSEQDPCPSLAPHVYDHPIASQSRSRLKHDGVLPKMGAECEVSALDRFDKGTLDASKPSIPSRSSAPRLRIQPNFGRVRRPGGPKPCPTSPQHSSPTASILGQSPKAPSTPQASEASDMTDQIPDPVSTLQINQSPIESKTKHRNAVIYGSIPGGLQSDLPHENNSLMTRPARPAGARASTPVKIHGDGGRDPTRSNVSDSPKSELPCSGSRPGFKWVRGELIAKDAYNKIYLALNATTGEMIVAKRAKIPELANDKTYDTRQAIRAVKVLKREAEILKDLDHPNVLQCFGFEETPYFFNIFLEYIPSGSIGSCLLEHGKFDEEITKSFTKHILAGLEYLHSRDIIHRGIKGDNILIGITGICKISSFSISTRTSNVDDIATFADLHWQDMVFWLAPEFIDSPKQGYDKKIDIWSVGCVVLEMWTGKRPWSGDEVNTVLFKVLESRLSPTVGSGEIVLSALAQSFYDQCFAINPEERAPAAILRKHPYLTLGEKWMFSGLKSN